MQFSEMSGNNVLLLVLLMIFFLQVPNYPFRLKNIILKICFKIFLYFSSIEFKYLCVPLFQDNEGAGDRADLGDSQGFSWPYKS